MVQCSLAIILDYGAHVRISQKAIEILLSYLLFFLNNPWITNKYKASWVIGNLSVKSYVVLLSVPLLKTYHFGNAFASIQNMVC